MPNAFDDISPPAATDPTAQVVIQPQVSARPRGNAFDDITPDPRAAHLSQGGAYFHDTETPEWEAKYGPTSGMNEWQLANAGIGRGLSVVGRNIGNLLPMTDMGSTPQERFMTGVGMRQGETHPAVS